MNLRRGLFRLWIVGTALFVLAIAFISYSEIKQQFAASLKPYTTFEVQLSDGRTFEVQAPDEQTAAAMIKTMIEALPEGVVLDKPAKPLADVTFVPTPWKSLGRWVSIAFGIPLAVLALGASLLWALSGFAATR